MSKIEFKEALKGQDLRFYKESIDEEIIKEFSNSLDVYAEKVDKAYKNNENEENFKNLVNSFLEQNFYNNSNYEINTKGKIDSAITKNGKILCIIETKSPQNKDEMLEVTDDEIDGINRKALHELIYYYLKETRDITGDKVKNKLTSQIRTLVATNSAKFFIFQSEQIESIVKGDIEEYFYKFENKFLNVDSTSDFYRYVEEYFGEHNEKLKKLDYVFFDMKEIRNKKSDIQYLYKILSKYYLLREKYITQANIHALNRKFYEELLYIMGLKEIKKDGKKQIEIDTTIKNSIGYQLYYNFIRKNKDDEEKANDDTFELLIILLNRILFIKLFEGQLISFNGDKEEYHILDRNKIEKFKDLEDLFFEILGKRPQDRHNTILTEFYAKFSEIPYLNSALFEMQDIEIKTTISELNNDNVDLKSDSILKNKQFKVMPILDYLIEFLNAYDFSSKEVDVNIKGKSKDIIDSSVLGLIFEKINGYKDGSVYTPSKITEYMAKQVVEKNVLRRVNEDLKFNCETIKDLEWTIKNSGSLNVVKKVNQVINSITYLDPAVGSGHFLVSLLNRIIYIKYQLGVLMKFGKNELENDYNIYIDDDTLIVEDAQGNPFVYKKENKSSQEMQETLFNEKRTIIENCLFGADINGNATYICQLRLWIELLKNAYYKNGVMETLPNIDINIQTGNSLISKLNFEVGKNIIELNKQININDNKGFIKAYKECIKNYVSEDNKDEKKKLREYLKKIDDEFIHAPLQQSMFNEYKKKEEEYDLYKNSLEWALQYPEVLGEDGTFLGFDCVIGNPPYIQLQKMGNESKDLEKMNYKVYAKTGDIYCLFFELAKKLVKKDGIIAFITSNKWMRAGYGDKLRNFLTTELNPILIFDLAGIKAFDDVTVDTNILMLENSNNKGKTISCTAKENCLDNIEDYIEYNKIYINFKGSSLWIIISDIEKSIKEKIEKYGTPLSEWDVNINRGILTGYNKAFIINGETKDKLIEEDPKSAEVIRPILRGRDIKRYSYDFKDLWLICIPCGYTNKNSDIDNKELWIQNNLPAIYKYLVNTEETLSEKRTNKVKGLYNRDDQGDYWWELRSCKYMDEFNKQKIIYPCIMSKESAFMLDNDALYYTIAPGNIITGDHLKYLLAILNSKTYYFALREFYMGGGINGELKTNRLLLLPVPKANKKTIDSIEEKVDDITKTNENTLLLQSKIEDEIQNIINLSKKEKDFINNTSF